MIKKRLSLVLVISLLLAANAGLSVAHDTGTPHTHDPAGDGLRSQLSGTAGFHARLSQHLPTNGASTAFLVIPIGGEFFPFHWLWHTMRGETVDNRIHLVHEVMGWYKIPRFHRADTFKDESDLSVSPPQYE